MTTQKHFHSSLNYIYPFIIFLLVFSFGNAQVEEQEFVNSNKPETELPPDILWEIKAVRPEATLKIKGIDSDGHVYDVVAIQNSEDTSVLNVKVLDDDKRLPVKLIVKGKEPYYPLKAIKEDGSLIAIKAVTQYGDILPVKGISKTGNIIHIRAIDDGIYYDLIAISPDGQENSIKGLKMLDTRVETIIHGVKVFAHVKSLQQD
ncbi:hypothetical protein [uncultured Psychroserpens sp.]|uniref:DUF7486 family protein n=1 Tax=uncultured Psychroserpens sp. TaxID=255436 RepID=UPI0026217D2E|nr:hypothetical protein [uncultured Psychroserpens sp.]